MSSIPQPPSTAARLATLERRVNLLEQRVAKLSTGPVVPGGDVFDANALTNPGAESGLPGWRGFWQVGGVSSAAWAVSGADALAGSLSFYMTSPAQHQSVRLMPDSGLVNSVPVVEGQVWELSALTWHDHVDPVTMELIFSLSTTQAGVNEIFVSTTLYVTAAQVPVAPGVVTAVSGQVTVPNGTPDWTWGALLCTPMPDGTKTDPVVWHAKADSLVLRRKLA